MIQPILQLTHLRKTYPIRKGLLRRPVATVEALSDLTLTVYPGETVMLVGAAGAGKTTAVRTILQLETPTSGQLLFNGDDITRLNKAGLRALRQQIQLLFPNPYTALNPRLRVRDIIAEPFTIHGIGSSADREARVELLMRQVGLNPYLMNRLPYELSGGNRLRVAIARALATGPSLLLADDPFSTLDSALWELMMTLLHEVKQANKLTLLFLTREPAQANPAYVDRVGILASGRLVEMRPGELVGKEPSQRVNEAR